MNTAASVSRGHLHVPVETLRELGWTINTATYPWLATRKGETCTVTTPPYPPEEANN